jgi:hypothetical protein
MFSEEFEKATASLASMHAHLFGAAGQNSLVYVLICQAHDLSTHAVLAAKMHH